MPLQIETMQSFLEKARYIYISCDILLDRYIDTSLFSGLLGEWFCDRALAMLMY